MFYLFRISVLTLLVCLGLVSCGKKEPDKAKIAVKLDSAANAEAELVTFNMLNLDPIVLAKTKFDSTGKGAFELSVDHPIFAFVKQGNSFLPVFLDSGDQLTVVTTGEKGSIPKYGGDGLVVNNYMQKVGLADRKYAVNDHRIYEKVDLNAFLAKKDSLEKELTALFADLEKEKTVKPEILKIMAAQNRIFLYSFTQKYITARHGYDLSDPEIPAILRKSIADLPQDSVALAAHIFEYGLVLVNHLQSGIMWPVEERVNSAKTDSTELNYPAFVREEIEQKNYIRPIEDHFKAANINFWLRMEGISDEVNQLWAEYQKTGTNAIYKKTIKESHNLWAKIAPGKPTPDFTGTAPDGKKISLSSLKGKLVYVDVWATWCGPCRDEFPHSKKLMKAFEGNDQIAFLYVSTDQNIDLWKKLLPDKSIPAGVHMHQKQENQPDAIWDNYHLWGIPRYILIDANGKMLQTHAPRPSSKEILPLLQNISVKPDHLNCAWIQSDIACNAIGEKVCSEVAYSLGWPVSHS